MYANDQWVTYRVRGGPQQADALFAPTTKTPWTDDVQLSYETDLGRGRSVMVLYTRRRTRDIIEDYDLALYALRDDGTTTYPGPVEHPGSLFLGLDNQDATRNQDLLAGAGGIDFGDGIRFTSPRRVFLGLRLNFQAAGRVVPDTSGRRGTRWLP